MYKYSARIGVILATLPVGGGMILSESFKRFYEENVEGVKKILREKFPEIKFIHEEAGTASDASKAMKKLGDVNGYLIFILRHLTGVLRPISRKEAHRDHSGDIYWCWKNS